MIVLLIDDSVISDEGFCQRYYAAPGSKLYYSRLAAPRYCFEDVVSVF